MKPYDYDFKFRIGNDKYILKKEEKKKWPGLVREVIYSKKGIWPYQEKVKDLNN